MKIKNAYFAKTIISIILGFIFHFIYDFLQKPKFLAFLFPISESVFEHTKLIFFPILIATIFIYAIYNLDFWRLLLISGIETFIGIILVPMYFYFYTCGFGTDSIVIVDIFAFVVIIILINLLGSHLYIHLKKTSKLLAIILYILLFTLFIGCTYFIPNFPMFIE